MSFNGCAITFARHHRDLESHPSTPYTINKHPAIPPIPCTTYPSHNPPSRPPAKHFSLALVAPHHTNISLVARINKSLCCFVSRASSKSSQCSQRGIPSTNKPMSNKFSIMLARVRKKLCDDQNLSPEHPGNNTPKHLAINQGKPSHLPPQRQL